MSTFNRGLDDAFVEALNQEYDKGGWWRRFVDDPDVFLAIRENRVDAYYRGCRLMRLRPNLVGEIHYKYLMRPSMSNEYVKVKDGKPLDDARTRFLTTVSEVGSLDSLKRAAAPYAGAEKTGVHDILKVNSNILDVEIAFGEDESDAGAPRIDFAALRASGNDVIKVVFFEAKHFDTSRKALRTTGAKPEVVQQIENYSCKLHANHCTVVRSYRRVCGNLLRLNGVAKRYEEHRAMLERVADGALDIDPNPVLIVFGFDGDQKDGKHWKPHREKLKEQLGEGRVHLKGNSAEFKSGIST